MLGSDSSTIVVIIRANERHRPIGSLNRLYTSLLPLIGGTEDRKSTRLNSSHSQISYAVFCLKKKSYVERGGSLAMLGVDKSFGLGSYQGTELEKAIPDLMKPPEHKQQQRALILVIDKCGSNGH